MIDIAKAREACCRCGIGEIWSVDGRGLCLGCQAVIRQERILDLEREAIMQLHEIGTLRRKLALADAVCLGLSDHIQHDMHDCVSCAQNIAAWAKR